MSLKCGIVGLPNVGKSTLFNALTKAGIAAENYPFCTIEPNVGIVEVPDLRLDVIAEIAQPQKVVPAVVEFVDIAGLVAGASKGEGLGNKFLANIRETDAIAHVVRCFEDPNVVHVAGKVNPVSDIETINTELALADLDSVERQLAKYEKVAQSGGDERRFDHFFACRAGPLRCLCVRLQAVGTLGRARHRNRDQFAVFFRNGAVVAPDDIVEPKPRVEIIRRELAHVAHQLQIIGIMVVFRHDYKPPEKSPHYSCICKANAIALTAPRGLLSRAAGSSMPPARCCHRRTLRK